MTVPKVVNLETVGIFHKAKVGCMPSQKFDTDAATQPIASGVKGSAKRPDRLLYRTVWCTVGTIC